MGGVQVENATIEWETEACEKCGSTEFCRERDKIAEMTWIICRNCDLAQGVLCQITNK
jgi:hypothetical protein